MLIDGGVFMIDLLQEEMGHAADHANSATAGQPIPQLGIRHV